MPDGLTIYRCAACGALEGAHRSRCPKCGSSSIVETLSRGNGRLYSWTIVRRPPVRFKDRPPYAVAVVDLEEGVRVTGRLGVFEPEPRLGAPMRLLRVEEDVAVFGERG